MTYRLIIHSQYEEELREQALDYQDQFSSGIMILLMRLKIHIMRIMGLEQAVHTMITSLHNARHRNGSSEIAVSGLMAIAAVFLCYCFFFWPVSWVR